MQGSQHPWVSRWARGLALCGSAALLAACGGGGEAGTPAVRPLSLSGTAAVGSALDNATEQSVMQSIDCASVLLAGLFA